MYWLNLTYGITYKIPFRSTGVWTQRNGKLVPDNGTGYKPSVFAVNLAAIGGCMCMFLFYEV